MRWFLVYQKSRGLGGLWGILLVFGGLAGLVVVRVVPFLIMGQWFVQFAQLAVVFVIEVPDQWHNKQYCGNDENTGKLKQIDEKDLHVVPRPIKEERRTGNFLGNVLDILEKLVWIMGKIEEQHGD